MSKFGALARKRLQQQHADRLRAEILRRGQVEAEPEPDDEDTGPDLDWFEHGARPAQRPPEGDDWTTWLMLAGRGWGKTRVLVEWAAKMAKDYPGSRGAVVAATRADVRDVLVEGPSGFLTVCRGEKLPLHESSRRRLLWPNGSRALTFSAEEPNRLRGPQFHWAIVDELAAWTYPEAAFDNLMLGLRLGKRPRVVIATTPRPTPQIKALLKQKHVHVTRGSTYENKDNLAPTFLQQIVTKYEGTRLGRQELYAEVLEDVEGALWTYALLDRTRVESAPPLKRVVVSVDPMVSAEAEGALTGIIVSGLGENDHGYVLADHSLHGLPIEWAQKAVWAYHEYEANEIVAEINQGGDMVEQTIRTVDPNVPVRKVHASKSKVARAEPVSALYEQGRIHHLGTHAKLEDELCQWVPGTFSPNRLDAAVWGLTALMLDIEADTVRATSRRRRF